MSSLNRAGRPRRISAVSAIVGLGLLGVTGCAQSGPGVAVSQTPAAPLSVGQALRADPRFTDFVRVIDFAGLAHSLNDAKNVTIFAPTNAAFDTTDPSWRNRTSPSGTTNFDFMNQAREQVIKQTVLAGIHPPADFIGRVQDVESLSGRVFHVNGLVDGAITVTAGVASPSGMGFPAVRPNQIARVDFPPITTSNGLIYPIDTIIK